MPHILLQEITGSATAPDPQALASDWPVWTPESDLLDSSGEDRYFVAEMDNDGRAHLRFGDGQLGRAPQAEATFKAAYRVGNGPAGNVGRDTITYLVLRNGIVSAESVRPRNPLPAQGGKDPEPVADIKLFAPQAFRGRLSAPSQRKTTWNWLRVIRKSRALRRSSGGWEAGTKRGWRSTPPIRRRRIPLCLIKQKAISIVTGGWATTLPLCRQRMCLEYRNGNIGAAALCARTYQGRSAGSVQQQGASKWRAGFFYPNNLRFGQGIYLSQLVAAAKAVEGVETARVCRFQRLNVPNTDALEQGVLPMGSWEIAQLDNDPSFPENGRLELKLGGGR